MPPIKELPFPCTGEQHVRSSSEIIRHAPRTDNPTGSARQQKTADKLGGCRVK